MNDFHRSLSEALARNGGPSTEDVEPIIVSSLRRNPRGEVRYMPNAPETTAMLGTSARGFLSEFDYAIAAAEARGAERGARAVVKAVEAELAAEEARLAPFRPDPSGLLGNWLGGIRIAGHVAREAAARVEGGA